VVHECALARKLSVCSLLRAVPSRLSAAYPRCSWRVDVILSTSEVSRVLRPCLLLEVTLSDGQVHTFKVRRFHSLRHAVAEALQSASEAVKRLEK
jgi:COMM domain